MEIKIGNYYKIKCGWGMTKAKLLGMMPMDNGKTRYEWESVTHSGFKFCSYDLEDTTAA